jgi:hypothetical protein
MFGDIDLSWSDISKIFHILTTKICKFKYNKTDHNTQVRKCTIGVIEIFQYIFFRPFVIVSDKSGRGHVTNQSVPPPTPLRLSKLLSSDLVKALCYKPEGRGFDSRWCYWNFSSTSTFQPHCGPRVDSASNRNEYQEYFMVGKGGRCLGLTTLPLSSADCLEIWAPQPPGTHKACPGL